MKSDPVKTFDPADAAQRHHKPHVARKRFGQNFLHDSGVINRIVLSISPQPQDRLIEIGPGQGALTFPLLRAAKKLTVIELDRDLIEPLRERARTHGEIEIISADVLKIDFTELAAGGLLRIVGNLPYNISTPILFHCLEHAAVIQDMHFMLQKEVVERMAAGPGSKTYGRLSVMLQLRCKVEPLFEVPPSSFTPAPKVDSAIVRLIPLSSSEQLSFDQGVLERVVRAAFSQRRKTLSNALSGVASVAQLENVGIDPRTRAEQVAPAMYVKLAQLLSAAGTD